MASACANALLLIIIISVNLMTDVQCETFKDDTWSQLDVQCLSESSAAVDQSMTISEIQCTMKGSLMSKIGLLIAQFSKITRMCKIFRYQSVCRQLIPGGSADCLVFLRFPINPTSMNVKLSNMWLADDMSRLENLVCQIDEDTNRFYPVDVEWTGDGVIFDGTSSHMVLNKSSIGFTGGLTWMLRIKRQPKIQPYFEFTECSTLGSAAVYGTHMWESDAPGKVYARTNRATGYGRPRCYTQENQLPSSPDEFVNIAFTTTPTGDSYDFFIGNSFLPRSNITQSADPDDWTITNMCMYFGKRIGDGRLLNGTLKALAFANVSMSEAEIRQFFSLIG